MGYRLKERVSIPGRARGFSLLHSVQTGFGAHSTSCKMDNGALSLGVK
jgi:hypothetical protein